MSSSLLPHLSSFVVLLAFLFLTVPARAELIDRIVASVNNDVITLRDLNQAVGFNEALGGGGENLRSQTLEGLINRMLLLEEARRLKFVEVSDQDVTAEVDKLRTRLGSDKALADLLTKLDMSPEDLRRMLGERLLVERFVEKKIGLFIRVNRDEAEDFYKRNEARFKGRRFQEVQKEIMAGLQQQKLDQQIAKYLAELKSRADIRVVG